MALGGAANVNLRLRLSILLRKICEFYKIIINEIIMEFILFELFCNSFALSSAFS
jgi:hypothetical protein